MENRDGGIVRDETYQGWNSDMESMESGISNATELGGKWVH